MTMIDQSSAGLVRLCVERHASPNKRRENEMQSMNSSTSPPQPTGTEYAALNALANIAALLADPVKAEGAIAGFAAAATTARATIEQAAKDKTATEQHRTEVMAELDRLKKAADDKRAAEWDAHQAKMASERGDLENDKRAIAKLRASAQADADRAASIKADFEHRLKVVSGAAA